MVLVTRPGGQGGELGRLLRERGATAVAAPTIELHPAEDDEELARSVVGLAEGRFSWLVVTSGAGVEALARAGMGPVEAKVAAVGEGTAGALESLGGKPDLVPSTFTTAALGRAMPRGAGRVLLARANIAPEGLEDGGNTAVRPSPPSRPR